MLAPIANAAMLPLGAKIAVWTVAGIAAIALLGWLLSCLVASIWVFHSTLHRTSKEKWSRNPQNLEGDSLKMDREGHVWFHQNEDKKTDVHIVNEGLNLYGQYFDLGYDRCVMILSGRTESLRYGYYFAQPYAKAGYNVLVLDPRAHGLSDGEFNTVGFDESRDDLAWAKFLHETYGMRSILFHGICIGAAGGMLAITSDNCPDYIEGIVTDGMFPNFGESIKNHLRERKKPIFLLYNLIHFWMKHYTGHSINYGPINVVHKLKKPILMLYSKEDLYSRPEYAQKIFDRVGSPTKKLVWFDHGKHSMIRVTNPEAYDAAIHEFLNEQFPAVTHQKQ